MSEIASTLLKVNFSEHQEVVPVVPGADDTPGAADTGFYTTYAENHTTEEVSHSTATDQAVVTAFFGLALFILIFVVAATIKKHRNYTSLENANTKLTKIQVFSAVSASVFLAVVFNSVIFSETPHIGPIDTTVSDELTIDADILGTDEISYVKDTITISASPYGYDLYISTDDSNDNRLIADSTEGFVNSVTAAGPLEDNTYGFSFEDPATNPNAFQPIQLNDDGKTSVRSFTPDQTATEQHIPIWYGVRSKNANEDVYRTNIEYQTIGEKDIALDEITPEICASLKEDILDYKFTYNGENYIVSKLKDGNCWTKSVPTDDPTEPVLACPANWHEANNYNYSDLDLFYHVKDPTTTADPIIVNYDQTTEHPEGSCIADFVEASVTYDSNGVDATNMPENRHLPDDTTEIIDYKYTIEMPATPSSDALCQSIIGWSRTSDGTATIYEPSEMVTFSSPNVKLYAIWSHQKTPKAILDVGGTLNFVYDYCTIEDVNNPDTGYKAAYEAEHPAIMEDGVYLVPKATTDPITNRRAPWLEPVYAQGSYQDSNPNIHAVNFDYSFKDFMPNNINGWFFALRSLTEINSLENLNTSNVTSMRYAFYGVAVSTIYIPRNFDNSVSDMLLMFADNRFLTSINSPDSTSFPNGFGQNAISMVGMFSSDKQLTTLSFPNGFGKEAKEIDNMFFGCGIKHIIFPELFGKKAREMQNMFQTSSVVTIEFPEDFGLMATDTHNMFDRAIALEHIYVKGNPDWNTSNITNSNNMFRDVDQLRSHIPDDYSGPLANDISNAHVGMKDGVWGYFEDACNIDQTCQDTSSQGQSTSTASPSLFFTPSTPEDEPEEPTTTPEPTEQSPESNTGVGPSPLGVSKASKDYSFTMILFIIAMVCLSSGTTLLILIIEKFKAEYREENDQF